MQNLAFRYNRYVNKKYNRIGHLFQGRFKSVIVDGNRYLKELVRYIHLNPVRANLVNHPEKYVWSSHSAYLQLSEYTWLTFDTVLKRFGSRLSESISAYESYILRGIGIETTLDFQSGHSDGILGDEEFTDKFLQTVIGFQKPEINLQELISKARNRFKLSEKALCAPGKNRLESYVRAMLALFVREMENLSTEELAVFLARDPSSLSKLASRLEKKCMQSPIVAEEVEALRKLLYAQETQMSECQA